MFLVFLVKNLLLKMYYFRQYKMKKNMSQKTVVIFPKNIWCLNLINKEIWMPFKKLSLLNRVCFCDVLVYCSDLLIGWRPKVKFLLEVNKAVLMLNSYFGWFSNRKRWDLLLWVISLISHYPGPKCCNSKKLWRGNSERSSQSGADNSSLRLNMSLIQASSAGHSWLFS